MFRDSYDVGGDIITRVQIIKVLIDRAVSEKYKRTGRCGVRVMNKGTVECD